ncbi:MAG: hypothetical protein CYG60_02855 [Actinobacteria bacterium]|jgi:hypothetical protein|nr:MAG: hypothetical protein CYG60_02855 [Actinomycetota bacterium]
MGEEVRYGGDPQRKQNPMPKITVSPPNDPRTPEEWQAACDAADALLKLDAARIYGLLSRGPEVDAERCWEIVHHARELHGIEPSEDAVEKLVAELGAWRTAAILERHPTQAAPVLTIGHSTRTFELFAGLLRANGVERLVDVRRFAASGRHSRFGGDALPALLRGEGIGYWHLPGLGGRRRPLPGSPNAGWRNEGFRGYADHMGTPEFREGLGRLLELAGRERACLMCSEAVWWRCHRRISPTPWWCGACPSSTS